MGRERSAKMWFPEKSSWVQWRRLECELHCGGYPAQRQRNRAISPGHGQKQAHGGEGGCVWGEPLRQFWTALGAFGWDTDSICCTHVSINGDKYLQGYISANVCCAAESLQSCLTLCNPMDCSPTDSSVHWILQARMLEWVAMPFSRDLPDSVIEPSQFSNPARFLTFPALGGEFFKKIILFIDWFWLCWVLVAAWPFL